MLTGKNILLGVTGSIAAYKSAELVRRLREAGATVRVAMTENAKRFITPLTMQAVSGFPVHDDLFDVHAEAAMGHIELARWADMIVVAPATADFMTRLLNGHADDLLTTVCLASKAHIAIAPAMNQLMWKNASTQHNLQSLIAKNILILGPSSGSQACGDIGPGRMLEPTDIVAKLETIFAQSLLANTNIIITAGPTHEAIDPIRFITNNSSGKMGYALAESARDAGANVILISGPVHLAAPAKIKIEKVITANDMHAAVLRHLPDCQIFISVAAVSDYQMQTIAPQKIHKSEKNYQLTLIPTKDILADVARRKDKPFVVGFAAETENVIQSAKNKLQQKNLDMIIANQVSETMGMNSDDNAVTVIWNQHETFFPSSPKKQLARELISLIAGRYKEAKHAKSN